MRTASQETALQIALRKCSKEVGNRSVCMKFWWRENTCNQVCIFPEGFWQSGEAFCQSQGTVITVKDFSAFLNLGRYKNWAHEICSWKYLTIWRPVLPVPTLTPLIPNRMLHFCSLNWTPFRGCWISNLGDIYSGQIETMFWGRERERVRGLWRQKPQFC